MKLDTYTVMFVFLLSMFLFPSISRSDSLGDYQLRRLLNPSPAEYSAEYEGRIYIYDGLDADIVDVALDNHFDRIDSMMFTRIVHTGAFGDQYVEEDGCD